jgi:hypothetical protein
VSSGFGESVLVAVKAALAGVQSLGRRGTVAASQGSMDIYQNVLHLYYN